MPEKPKRHKDSEKSAEKPMENEAEKHSADSIEETRAGNWSEDQRKKSYYYDDDYGYEIYNPDDEDDED